MAWPVTRASGFLVTSTAWNEIVNAFSTWGGNVAASGNSLTGLLNLALTGTLTAGGSVGSSGQVLQSTGTGIQWATFSLNLAVTSKTSAYSILTTDSVILCNATTAAFTVTLPTAVGNTGETFYIKKTDSSSNAITIATTSSQTIDGATTKTITSQYTTLQLVSDGANWQIL